MKRQFRKLHIDLPRQPLINQRPWLIAGLLLVSVILLIAAYSYFVYKKSSTSSDEHEKQLYKKDDGLTKRTPDLEESSFGFFFKSPVNMGISAKGESTSIIRTQSISLLYRTGNFN